MSPHATSAASVLLSLILQVSGPHCSESYSLIVENANMVMPKATADDPSLMVCEWSTVILEENTRIQICFIIG